MGRTADFVFLSINIVWLVFGIANGRFERVYRSKTAIKFYSYSVLFILCLIYLPLDLSGAVNFGRLLARMFPHHDAAVSSDNRCRDFLAKGETQLAINNCNTAIELDPNFADSYFDRGTAYKAQGNTEHAADDFEMAEKLRSPPKS